jgi:hypothetical protein
LDESKCHGGAQKRREECFEKITEWNRTDAQDLRL